MTIVVMMTENDGDDSGSNDGSNDGNGSGCTSRDDNDDKTNYRKI